MILCLTLDLPEDEVYVHTTRLLSRTIMEDLQVVQQDQDDIETILSELCTNVVRHAHSHNARYQIQIEFYKERVVMTVSDQGPGFTQKNIPPVGAVRPDQDGRERVGGFGLLLLNALSDRIVFTRTEPHGTTARAEKTLHYQTPGAAEEARELDKGAGGKAKFKAS